MISKKIALALIMAMVLGLLSGCGEKNSSSESSQPVGDPVTITVAGGWLDCKALDEVGRAFTKKYPNCTVTYEYLQDYYASVEKRMTGDSPIDLFFTTNIQSDSDMLPYALDLISCEDLDLSKTFEGLIDNFSLREENSESKKLYAIPLGAEMRGMYVNTTLLKSLGINTPTNQKSFLEACATLKEKGFIPLHGNPGNFAQLMMYPWICNTVANAENYQETYDKVNSKTDISATFKKPFEFLYGVVENRYYDYKTAQTDLNLFNELADEDYARYFLNISKSGEEFVKDDDVGKVAFMPSAISLKAVIDKFKEDYHSEIEYKFMPAPVGEDGGYVYLSPAHGIAVNKDSVNKEWSIKFLDFLFTPENNKTFAESFNIMPNTSDVFEYASKLFDVDETHISQLGQVTFDWGFYKAISSALTDVSKANNPKYMKDSTTLYPLDYYLNLLEESVKAQ